jgi:phosphomannomutase/phosphoglucomutase
VNPDIFRRYDIRGLADSDLTDEVVERIAKAYGSHLRRSGRKKVVVGKDVRLSSPRIASSAIRGLVSTGCNVADLGIVPTPVLYYSIQRLNAHGAVMVTGSHLLKKYNGLKLCIDTDSFFGKDIQKLRKAAKKGDFLPGRGRLSRKSVTEEYVDAVISRNTLERSVRVVLDPGNGTAGPIASRILRGIGCRVKCINCKPDGRFPAHQPDPTVPAYMRQLVKVVKETRAEIGIGIDGDGDRIGVVDELGKIVWGDRLLALYSEELLSSVPKAEIIFEVKCSQALPEYIRSLGGRPKMWKTGHSLIKAKMKKDNALLAGEMSGHMFFAHKWYGFDDAIYASAKTASILSRGARTMSELLTRIPSYFATPETRIGSTDKRKFEVVKRVKEHFTKKYRTVNIDGVRIEFGDGWGLVRASNTEPIIVARFEATTKKRLAEIQQTIMSKVNQYNR